MPLINQLLDYINNNIGDFNQLALALFAYQYEHGELYQQYCRRLKKSPDQVVRWQDIPAVSTEVFRAFALSTLPISEAKYVFQTSGTSQHQKGKHYYHDMQLYDAAIQNSFMAGIGLSPHAKAHFRILTPSFAEVPTSSLFYMFQKIKDSNGESDSDFYFENNKIDCVKLLANLQEDIAKNRAIVLLGTAFSFVNFCDYLIENHIILNLPPESRLLETGGLKGRTREVSRDELYQLFVERLGVQREHCFSEYGMTELSSQCYSLPNTPIFHSPRWMTARVIHPETGQEVDVGDSGLVQFFDLANMTAVSAIVTSDLAIRHPHGFELMGRAPNAMLRGCSTLFEGVSCFQK